VNGLAGCTCFSCSTEPSTHTSSEEGTNRSSPEGSKGMTVPCLISPLQAALRSLKLKPPLYSLLHDDKSRKGCGSQQERVVMLLLDCGSNPNDLGGGHAYPIQVASRHCSDLVIERLIIAGADVNAKGEGDLLCVQLPGASCF
jgi:hypothetical protein